LRALKERHRLAVVSNFDYTPDRPPRPRAGRRGGPLRDHRGVRRGGLAQAQARHLRAGAGTSGLFSRARPSSWAIGRISTWRGAQAVGMASAWINREASALPEGMKPPSTRSGTWASWRSSFRD
jgi:hypothetical protein